ncbi:MAG: dihydrofolate reductase [Anaerolineae bacterium]|nr:dihydrofolate reductase [Anaerolineae bacterium]
MEPPTISSSSIPVSRHLSPLITFMVAVAANGVIGRDNQLPWRLPGDLQRLKRLTMGKAIIMGRKTHESIGRPLPGRLNIILTRQMDYRAEGCVVVHTVDEAIAAALQYAPSQEIIIFGGADIYRLFLPQVSRLYLTVLADPFPGDTYFPSLEWSEWHCISQEYFPADEQNPHAYTFTVWERVGEGARS